MEISVILIQVLVNALFAQAQQNFYLTQFPPIANLASCASNGFTGAANTLTHDCNTLQAPTAFASCVCLKNQNSDFLSEQIVSSVAFLCGSTATQDVTSAVAVLSSYCSAVPPKPTPATIVPPTLAALPSLTDLPTAVTLGPCAASAVSAAVDRMTTDIPPLADTAQQASCACVKNNNSAIVSSNIVSQVENFCSSTATEDITSALAAFSTYCALGTTALPNTTFAPTITSVGPMSDIEYITSLASCASNAFTGAVDAMTNTCNIASGVTAFASCVCANSTNSNSMSVTLVNYVKDGCSSTATEDITSALGVMSSYCALVGGKAGPATAAVTGPGAVTTATSMPSSTSSGGLGLPVKGGIGGGLAFLLLAVILIILCSNSNGNRRSGRANQSLGLGPVQSTGGGGSAWAGNFSSGTTNTNRDFRRDNDFFNQNQRETFPRDRPQQESWSRPVNTGPSDFQREERRQDGLRAAESQRQDNLRAAEREINSKIAAQSYMKVPL